MNDQKQTFHETISKLLEQRITTDYKDKGARASSLQIYLVIFESITNIFKEVKAPIGNEAANYLAQQYYDGVLVNGREILDPNVFDQRAKVENIPTKELAFLAVLLEGTDFRLPILEEIKKRS